MNAMRPLLILAALAAHVPAAEAAITGDLSMEILVDGRPLRELPHHGRTYVEAIRGEEYTVRLTNRTPERVAVALAVDGLNSIDARRTSAREAAKWILGPWESITIAGWQTSGSTARRFYFTTEEDSYGAWLGKTKDLGVISAALFREKRPRFSRLDRVPSEERSSMGKDGAREAPSASPQAEKRLADDLAATGIGREIDHRVERVRFDAEPHPSATIDLRYEYRDALVRLGVLRRYGEPLARREDARGFEDTGYSPDPYRKGR